MTTRNENYTFEVEYFKRDIERDAWDKISIDYSLPWSTIFIDKNCDKLNWELLSKNIGIVWSEALIDKYKHKIDWTAFTKFYFSWGREVVNNCFEIIKKFEQFWDWKELSKANITYKVIEEYAHRLDWEEIIYNHRINWNYEMFDKCSKYILIADISDFKRSKLWDNLAENEAKIIVGKLLSE